MSYLLRKGCPRCGRPTRDGKRCGRCKRAAGTQAPKRRSYSDTAQYRRVRDEVLATWGAVCALYCGQPIDLALPATSPESLVLAHVVSHADGGAFEPDNLRPAHRSCNASAGRESTGGPLG